MSWQDYWNADTSIYVSERHQQLHYRGIAEDSIRLIDELCPGPATAAVLDFGCGQALDAARVAQHCGRLVLADSAPRVLADLRRRNEGNARIEVCAADAVGTRYGAEFDLVIVNSVIQYLTRAELDELLAMVRGRLAPGGHLVVADVIPPDTGALADAAALLAFAARGGFLTAALAGLVRTAFSDYRTLRAELGIARHDEAAMLALLAAAGFGARRHPRNMGHNRRRMTFVAAVA